MTIKQLAQYTAEQAHATLMEYREDEPLNGDEVDEFAKHLKDELNKLNGNQ